MVTVNLELIATILGVLGVVASVVGFGYKLFKRFERLEHRVEHSEELHTVLITGLLACLDGLKQQGCNGEVTKAISTLRQYLARVAG